MPVKGIAFDGGYGITDVLLRPMAGKTWTEAQLGQDLGKYSFREWQTAIRLAARHARFERARDQSHRPIAADGALVESGRLHAQHRRNRRHSRRVRNHDEDRHSSPLSAAHPVGAATLASAEPVTYDLPEETAVLKPGPGLEAAQNNCVACHSADYLAMQPPKRGKAFWDAEVTKMIKTYGAPIAEADAKAIADYLAQTY